MREWAIKVEKERKDLEEKILKLSAFLNSDPMILWSHHKRLRKQLKIMIDYYKILTERIFYFGEIDEAD